jgi:hypothetical protein
MNPHRTASFQIRECLRLAAYVLDGDRLYSDQEIASQLGASAEWVAAVLAPDDGADTTGRPVYDVSYQHDSRIKAVDSIGHLINIVYDSARFTPRETPTDQDAQGW